MRRWLRRNGSQLDSRRPEDAVLGNNSAGDDPEVVEDAAALTSEAPIAVNENPMVGGSG